MRKRPIIFICILSMIGLTYFVNTAPPIFIETYYTLGFNKWFLQFLSHCMSFFPFSIFEVGLYSLLLCLLYRLMIWLYIAFKRTASFKAHLGKGILHICYLGLTLVFIFYWSWGFNYNRVPLSTSLNLTRNSFTSIELGELYEKLIERTPLSAALSCTG